MRRRRRAAPAPPRRPRRVLLFCPATDRRKIDKAAGLDVDGVIIDLEDAVAAGRKDEARAAAVAALEAVDFGRRERLVRINPFDEGPGAEDLNAVLRARRPPDAIVVPKTGSAADLRRIGRSLDRLESARRLRRGAVRLVALVETARGVVGLPEIVRATPRLAAIAFGAEDLVADLGGVRTAAGQEVLYPRSAVALHCAAAGLQAIDTPFIGLHNEPGLLADARAALALGYAGKLAIHPAQVGPILSIFSPGAEELAAALRLLHEHARRREDGVGAFAFEGRMVDLPMVRAARAVVARARAAGQAIEDEEP